MIVRRKIVPQLEDARRDMERRAEQRRLLEERQKVLEEHERALEAQRKALAERHRALEEERAAMEEERRAEERRQKREEGRQLALQRKAVLVIITWYRDRVRIADAKALLK